MRFRYRGSTAPALDGVSFTIPEGSIFGIMGRSGSGKTTVTRLLQLLHSNYEGLIKIDGNDLRQIDVDHLRSSLGVVLQENFLFSGTIRETIAAAKPDASFEELLMRRGSPAPRSSSSGCRAATRPTSRRARPICRAASASVWRSPAR